MARIECAVVNHAHAVGTDAAYVVCGGLAAEGHGGILARCDAVHQLALGTAENLGIVAVNEAGETAVVIAEAGKGLRPISAESESGVGRGKQAVGEIGVGTRVACDKANEAAPIGRVGARKRAIKHAADKISCFRTNHTHETAVRAITVPRAADGDGRAAIREVTVTKGVSNHTVVQP